MRRRTRRRSGSRPSARWLWHIQPRAVWDAGKRFTLAGLGPATVVCPPDIQFPFAGEGTTLCCEATTLARHQHAAFTEYVNLPILREASLSLTRP